VLQSLVDVLQAVRFLTDTLDQVNLDVPPLQQSCRLLLARLAERICTFSGDKKQEQSFELVSDPLEDTRHQDTKTRAEIGATRLVHQDPIAHRRRSEAQHRQAAACRAWNASDQPEWLDETFYRKQIQPRLSAIKAATIKFALSISEAYALRIRGGRCIPHPRHWLTLSALSSRNGQSFHTQEMLKR
jgi:hypothetical protein